jgi:hypothetical protein
MRLALGCLLCAPSILAGQSAYVSMYQQDIRSSQRGAFVLLDDESGSLAIGFRKLLREEGLAELRLGTRIVLDRGRQAELVEYLRQRYSWADGPRWAFIDPNERCLAQGTALPDAQALADRLAEAGVESPVRRMRALARQNPANLDVKLALLRLLRSIAEERTRGVLEEEYGDGQNYRQNDRQNNRQNDRRPPMGSNWRTARLLRQAEEAASGNSPVQLSAEDDLRIWVRWADEFDRLMASGQWLESDFSFDYGDEFLERHSAIVRNIYNKRIGVVEDALRRWPASERIWGIWLHISLALGDRSIQRLMNSLVPMPDTVPGTCPPYEAKMVMIQEARRNGDWRDLRYMLWDSWMQLSQSLPPTRGSGSGAGFFSQANSRMAPRLIESQWQQLIEPLLESLLMTGDISGADSVVYRLRETSGWDEIADNVAAVARRCQMPQVASRWAN